MSVRGVVKPLDECEVAGKDYELAITCQESCIKKAAEIFPTYNHFFYRKEAALQYAVLAST